MYEPVTSDHAVTTYGPFSDRFPFYSIGDRKNESLLTNSCDLDGINITTGMAVTAFTLSFFTMLGNVLVVVAITVDPYKELRTIPNYLILNLAVCDLFVGPSELLLGLLHFSNSSYLYLVAYTCIYLSMVASALTILTLAFERCIVVAAPLQSKEFLIYSHLNLAIV